MQTDIKNIDPEELIIRYYSGNLSEEENELLLQIINSDSEAKSLFNQYALIKHSVSNVNPDYKLAFEKFCKNNSKQKIKIRPIYIALSSIAALLLILLTISVLFKPQKINNFIIATNDTIKEHLLPDSSIITFNSNTQITYTSDFNNNRMLTMDKGEAFFNVKPDKSHPFVIKVSEAVITVLGTSFNIKIDSLTQNISVSVISGKVSVGTTHDTIQKYFLTKNQTSIFSAHSKNFCEPTISTNNELSWKTNELIFKSTPLPVVIEALNNHFGTNYILEGSNLDSCRLNATFPNPDLNNILQMLNIAYGIEIKEINNKKVLSGSGC